jgi:hypothetical protein
VVEAGGAKATNRPFHPRPGSANALGRESEAMAESADEIVARYAPEGFSVPVVQLAGLNRSGVYFLYRDGIVVYVGQARDIRRRVASHMADGVKDFDSVSFIPFAVDKLLSAEARYIRRLRPMYNLVGNAPAAAGYQPFGSFAPSHPLVKASLTASEAAARLGVPVETLMRLWHSHGYRPKRLARSKAHGYCPIDCDEIVSKMAP